MPAEGDGSLRIGQPDLLELTPNVTLFLGGQTATHPENHFGTPRTRAAIEGFGFLVQQATTGGVLPGGLCLNVNDMSLDGGGIFDLGNQFAISGGHCAHRRGNDFDSFGLHECLSGHLFGANVQPSAIVRSSLNLPSGLTIRQLILQMAQRLPGFGLVPADEGPVHFRVP